MGKASKNKLEAAQHSLRKYNASRKLKKAANRLIAANRMSGLKLQG